MLRGCVNLLLFLAGAWFVGLAFEGTPCRDNGWGFGIIVGPVLFGAVVFRVADGASTRTWIPWVAAVATAILSILVLDIVGVLRWVGECAN